MAPTDREHAQLHVREAPADGVLDYATSMLSSVHGHPNPRRLERDRRRLAQVRASLERLYLEMRHDLRESEQRNACATVRIRLLLRDAERRDRGFASARRRIRILLKDAARRDREYVNARHRIRLLVNDAERRDREFAGARRRIRILLKDAARRDREYMNARHRIRLLLNDAERRDRESASVRRQVRILLKDAERRDREYAHVRAQLRSLRHFSAGLAAGFLAITESRRWRLGDALLSFPSRVLGRRAATAADDLHSLATTLALGQTPRPTDSTDHDNVDRVDH